MYFLKSLKIYFKEKHFFWFGVFFLGSAPTISSLFFIFSTINKLKFFKSYIKDRWNFPFVISTLLMVASALYIKFDNSFFLKSNDSWDSNLLILGLFNWIPFFIFFWSFQDFLKSKKDRYLCALLFISSNIPVLISGFGQYFFQWYGPTELLNGLIVWYQRPLVYRSGMTGLFNNANYIGLWLNIIFPFLLIFIKINQNNFCKKLFSILLSFLTLVAILLTASRSAWLCAGITLFFCYFLIFESKKFLNLIFIFIPIFLIFVIKFFPENSYYFFGKLTRNYEKLDITRFEIWKYTFINILKKPFFGWGSGSFPFLIEEIKGIWKGHPHNLYLELFFSYGVLVGSIILSTFYKIISISFSKIFSQKTESSNYIDKAWFIGLFIILFSQLLDIQYFDFRISFSLWILLAGLKNIIHDDIISNEEKTNNSKFFENS